MKFVEIFSCILFINHGLVFLVELDKPDRHHQQQQQQQRQRHHHRLVSAPPQSTSMSIPFSCFSSSSTSLTSKPCDVQRSTCFIAAIVFANDELSLLRTYVNRYSSHIEGNQYLCKFAIYNKYGLSVCLGYQLINKPLLVENAFLIIANIYSS